VRRQRGFSLLEAIVSMVLVAGVGFALFGWINGNINALFTVQEANARSEATGNILEYMHTVNPMLTPRGNAQLGSYRIDWDARPVGDVVDRESSFYQFGLYDTRIGVARAGQPWFEMQLQQVGYRKVRSTQGIG
jgi:general secretion pathway protein I